MFDERDETGGPTFAADADGPADEDDDAADYEDDEDAYDEEEEEPRYGEADAEPSGDGRTGAPRAAPNRPRRVRPKPPRALRRPWPGDADRGEVGGAGRVRPARAKPRRAAW